MRTSQSGTPRLLSAPGSTFLWLSPVVVTVQVEIIQTPTQERLALDYTIRPITLSYFSFSVNFTFSVNAPPPLVFKHALFIHLQLTFFWKLALGSNDLSTLPLKETEEENNKKRTRRRKRLEQSYLC